MAIELKTDPKYGYYPWWPENGDDWIHPEDVALARSLIPSGRVFRREGTGRREGTTGEFVCLQYGPHRHRVRRKIWQEVAWEGFDIGDLVEVRTRGMKNEHRNGTIREMLWDSHVRVMHYQLEQAGQPVETLFTTDDLKHVEQTDDRVEVRVEPRGEEE